jgi:hypothetical protein
MKKKKILSIIFVTLILISCSKNNRSNFNKRSFIVLSGTALDIVPTKAGVNLADGTRLGVYVLNVTPGSMETFNNALVKNSLYTVNNEGSILGSIIYLNMGKDYDVYSYAPKVESVPDHTSIEFSHGTDLIWSQVNQTVRGAIAGQNNVNLQFLHKTSQIRFTLTDDRDNASKLQYPFAGATFEVTGFYDSYSLNLENGVISRGVIDNNIKISTINTPVCFAANDGPMSLSVTVTIPGTAGGNQLYTGTLTNTFSQGYSYSYNIKLASTTLVMTGTITDWVVVPTDDFIIHPS